MKLEENITDLDVDTLVETSNDCSNIENIVVIPHLQRKRLKQKTKTSEIIELQQKALQSKIDLNDVKKKYYEEKLKKVQNLQ